MTTEKNSEKLALYVALIASVLALCLTTYHTLKPSTLYPNADAGGAASSPRRSPGGPAGFGGFGGGRMTRGFAPSPEYLQLLEEQEELSRQLFELQNGSYQAGGAPITALIDARLQWDLARLKLMRVKNNQRPTPAFAEAYLEWQTLQQQLQACEAAYQSGQLPLDQILALKLQLSEAALQLSEKERFLNPEQLAEAKEMVKSYSAPLTDEQLEKLLAAEQRSPRGSAGSGKHAGTR